MKVSFGSANYAFYANLNDTSAAKEIARCLPLELRAEQKDENICFPVNIDLPRESNGSVVEKGDIVWLPQQGALAVWLREEEKDTSHGAGGREAVTVIGKVLASLDEIKQLAPGTKISLSAAKEDKPQAVENKSSDYRMMNQDEIDTLVKELLGKKG
ncbi:MAG: cyclophilin-like fold protein [Candidatus Omnitrophota bacterium]